MINRRRHKWSEPEKFNRVTKRVCSECGLFKLTRHEPQNLPPHWIEYWRGTDRITGDRTPPCEAEGVGG